MAFTTLMGMPSWLCRSRLTAAMTLIAVLTLTIWSAAPHGDGCHPDDCAAFTGRHDHSSHRIGRDAPTEQRPLHCVLCHWSSLVRPPAAAVHHVDAIVEASFAVREDSSVALTQASAARPPLRAPPASPAIA